MYLKECHLRKPAKVVHARRSLSASATAASPPLRARIRRTRTVVPGGGFLRVPAHDARRTAVAGELPLCLVRLDYVLRWSIVTKTHKITPLFVDFG